MCDAAVDRVVCDSVQSVAVMRDRHAGLRRGCRASTAVLSLALVVAGLFAPMITPPGARSAEEVQAPSGDAASSGSTARADVVREILSGATAGISANPGAVNILTGTGLLGRLLGFGPDSGVRLGGLWIGNANYLFAGGAEPRMWSFNGAVLVC